METSSLYYHSVPMNADCWREIFNLLLSTKSIIPIWRLMCVCKVLYNIGIPTLVRTWSNILSSKCAYDPPCVERFCRFMLSGDGMRPKCLRKLDVADILVGPMWSQHLIFRVISMAVYLEELELDGDLLYYYLQDSNNSLHFNRLASLTLRSANDVGHAFQELRAPIKRLTLDFDDVDDDLEDDDEELPDSFSFVFPFRDSVEELRVTNGWLDDIETVFACSRLTSLQLESTFIPPVGHLARIFPNLQLLEVIFCFSEHEGDEFRAVNERSQQGGDTWHHLDFISVHRPGFLYGLALVCTTRCVAFELVDGFEEAELASSLLAAMQPTSLRLSFRSSESLQHVLTSLLSGVIGCISELHIIVDISQESGLFLTVMCTVIVSTTPLQSASGSRLINRHTSG
jgi:hypothetical protein